MKKVLKLLVLSLGLVCLFMSCGKEKEVNKPLVMGLVPVSNSEKLIEDTAPLHNLLSEKIGKKVDGFIATNYVGVVEALGSGSIDFALIPPFAYILANTKHNTEALLTSLNKHGEPGYYSIIITRKDTGIKTIEDLKGKKIAFVDPSSTSGYIIPSVILQDHSIDREKDIQGQFAGGHDNALQLLMNGDVDAIGTYENIIKRYAKDFDNLEERVVVLEKSDLIPGIALAVSSKVDEVTKSKIKEAFLSLNTDEKGKKMIKELFGLHGFQDAKVESYKTLGKKLNKLGIELEKIK